MPSRNVRKIDAPASYYHVYARGASKQTLFLEHRDFEYFINLFSRYLSISPVQGKLGIPYPHLRGKVELLAYCIMNNHFHLLLYQEDPGAMSQLMKSIMTSYTQYFNLKYNRSGSIYESTYKASLINSDSYLTHISRYIHLNPRYWRHYKYSSIRYYLSGEKSEWLATSKIVLGFANKEDYLSFLLEYEDEKVILGELKYELAHL